MTYQNILVPVDFSECAINAVRLAKKIALSTGAQLTLMTVTRAPDVHADAIGAGVIAAPVMAEYDAHTEKQFEKLIEEESLDRDKLTRLIYTSGFNDAVKTCLDDHDIDLIVTGTHEEHGVLDQMLGSNSSEIIRKSDVPVLMLPEKVTDFNFKKIGLAVNFNEENDFEKLSIVKDFATLFNANVTVIHVTDQHDRLFIHDDEKVELAKYLEGTEYSFFTFNSKDDVVKVLLDSIDDLELDVIFMHPKKHGALEGLLHPSKTKSMALKVKIPLLTLHE